MANIRELVDEFTAAFNAHDLDSLDRLTSPDCTMEAPGNQRFKGIQELRGWNEAWMRGFPDCRINTLNTIVSGNVAVTESTFEGTHDGTLATPMGDIPATGKRLKGPFVQIATFSNTGLTTSVHLYYDVADIMQQLGLLPAPAAVTA